MYLNGHSTWVEVEGLTGGLCGRSRPGHFRGVCTVVTKLLSICQPDRVYLGEKDAQQLAVIERMVRDLNLRVEVVPCPIVREVRWTCHEFAQRAPDHRGTGSSSRVVSCPAGGAQRGRGWREKCCETGHGHPRSACTSAAGRDRLRGDSGWGRPDPARRRCAAPVLIALAVRFGPVRLIDNVTRYRLGCALVAGAPQRRRLIPHRGIHIPGYGLRPRRPVRRRSAPCPACYMKDAGSPNMRSNVISILLGSSSSNMTPPPARTTRVISWAAASWSRM